MAEKLEKYLAQTANREANFLLEELCSDMSTLDEILIDLSQSDKNDIRDPMHLKWLDEMLVNVARRWNKLVALERGHHSLDCLVETSLYETLTSHTIGVFTKANRAPFSYHYWLMTWKPLIKAMIEKRPIE